MSRYVNGINFRILNFFILFISFILICYKIDVTWFNVHMSRDLMRAMNWAHLETIGDWSGPEMGWDFKRLPGPFYYWLLAPVTYLGSIQALLIYKVALTFLVFSLLVVELHKHFEQKVTTAFLLLLTAMPLVFSYLRILWNPSMVILFDCFQILFLLKYIRTQNKYYVLASTLAAALGVQCHFSTMLAYLAFVLSVLITQYKHNKPAFKYQLTLVAVMAIWLLSWYRYSYTSLVNDYVVDHYGNLNFYFLYKFQDLLQTFSFVNYYVGADYSPFGIYAEHIKFFGIYDFQSWQVMFRLLNWGYTLLFIIGYISIVTRSIRTGKLWDTFLSVYFVLFFIATMSYSSRAHVPFRFLLCFYPVQFLIMVYGFNELRPNLTKYLLIFAGLSFVSYSYFNLKTIEFQEVTGRTTHRWDDTLELSLKYKLQIYDFIKKNSNFQMDPFEELHGRAVNKMRYKEYNWEHTLPYYGLLRIVNGEKFTPDPKMMEKLPTEAWSLYFRDRFDIQKNPGQLPYVIEKLNVNNLPSHLKISYLNEHKNLISEVEWKNSNLILPFAFFADLSDIRNVCFLKIQFQLDAGANKFFNVAFDGVPPGGMDTYIIEAFKNHHFQQDGKVIEPVKRFIGFAQTQKQFVYEMRGQGNSRFELELEVNRDMFKDGPRNNYFRVDLYGINHEPFFEELFDPKEFARDNYVTKDEE